MPYSPGGTNFTVGASNVFYLLHLTNALNASTFTFTTNASPYEQAGLRGVTFKVANESRIAASLFAPNGQFKVNGANAGTNVSLTAGTIASIFKEGTNFNLEISGNLASA